MAEGDASSTILVLSSVQFLSALHATCACTNCNILLKSLFALPTIEYPQELAQSRRDVTQLKNDVEHLCKEKADLLEKVETHKMMVR